MQFSENWIDRRGCALHIRPVQQDDAAALEALIHSLSYDDRRWRFHCATNGVSRATLQRMVCIDAQSSAAFVVAEVRDDAQQLLADARWVVDDSHTTAEFGLFVHPAWRRRRLGERCMRTLCLEAARRGLQEMHGYVCAENSAMLALMDHCGFDRQRNRHDARLVDVRLQLSPSELLRPSATQPAATS